ncbi:hypothetical protein EBV26_15900 [bacterium]|jgi:hypothetical protein|nr:hypothetical protein [bacterium]
MAKIPSPEPGQPIDVSYIDQIVRTINDLSVQVSPAIYKYVTVDVPKFQPQSLKISETRLIGGYVDVFKGIQSVGAQKDFFYQFKPEFKYPPIVVATPVNINGTEAGKTVTVVLKEPQTSRVDGTVIFNSAGDVSIGVNLLIIGVPN